MRAKIATSSEFHKFTDFVRKIVNVPKEEIEAIKKEEREEKLKKGKKPPLQPTP